MAAAHQKALDVYGANVCVVGVDLYNVEIEVYGCAIIEPVGNGVPVAGSPVFDEADALLGLQLDPAVDGRMPMILETAAKLARTNPGAEVRVPLAGPFTIACHLLGMENTICELFTDPESTGAALMHLAENQLRYARAAQARGIPVSVFESSVTPPLLSPQLFAERVLPALRMVIAGFQSGPVAETQLIIGGDTVQIAKAIASSGADYIICPVETDQEAFMARLDPDRTQHVRVNMNPAVFLSGRRSDALDEAKRARGIAARYSNTSVGSLLPVDADPGIVLEVKALVETGG
jgi:uroporphyrinogen-III decarboxylase